MESYGYYNPLVKLVEFCLLLLLPIFTSSLVGMVLNLVLILLIYPRVYLETYKKKKLLKNLRLLVGLLFLIFTLCSYLSHETKYIYNSYNVTCLIVGVKWAIYAGNLYLYGTILKETTSLFEACMSISETGPFPSAFSYYLYRDISFLRAFPNEFKLLKTIYANRGIKANSFKLISLVSQNLKRKFKSNDLMMEAKGFNKNRRVKRKVKIRFKEILIPLIMLIGNLILKGICLKGWLI